MSKTVELCQITTDPQSAIVEHVNFIAEDERGLDTLEYHLGLWRGDIARYRDSPMMSTSLHVDMVELLKTSSWAILPSTDILHKIQDLYEYNHERSTATDERKLFTDVLPEDVYEYELMPVSTPERRPVHVSGKCYKYPYHNMPRIRSTVHPCFVLRLLGRYRHQDINFDYAPSPISTDVSVRALLSEIAITASSCVNLSWLHGTWFDFRERGVAIARCDPKPPARESPVPEAEEEIHTDEERDLEDPRLVRARYELLAYMAKHNTRSGGTAAAPPTAGSSTDVPGKRKRSSASASPAPSDSPVEQSGKRQSKRLKASRKPLSQGEPITSNLVTPPPTVRRSSRKTKGSSR